MSATFVTVGERVCVELVDGDGFCVVVVVTLGEVKIWFGFAVFALSKVEVGIAGGGEVDAAVVGLDGLVGAALQVQYLVVFAVADCAAFVCLAFRAEVGAETEEAAASGLNELGAFPGRHSDEGWADEELVQRPFAAFARFVGAGTSEESMVVDVICWVGVSSGS